MILKNTIINIKNSIFKIKKDKCLKDLILNPFRYSEVISQSKLIGGRYTSAQTALGAQASTRGLGAGKVWAWTRSGRGQRSKPWTMIRGEVRINC